MSVLTFEKGGHVYRADGVVVPSVTQIIAPLTSYAHIPPDVLEKARQEGTAVHKLVELDCRRDLDEDTLPEWMRPYLAAWRSFVAEFGFQLEASEERVFNQTMRYAGTLDLRGWTRKNERVLIDIKRSFAAGPAIGVQTAAYAHASGWPNCERFGLQLRPNGTYRLRAFNDSSDWSVFLSCLTLHRYHERHEK